MRTIKFRGKRIDNGEWVYGYYSFRFNSHRIQTIEEFYFNGESSLVHEVEPSSIGQFTGLTDKNEKEIYEGDIVKQEKWVSVGKYAEATGVVVFKSPLFTVECIGDWHGSNADLNCNSEIIGNTTDNPELLNK